jgi:hypothetical protein
MPSRITAGMDIAAVKDYGIGLRLSVKRIRSSSDEGKARAPLWRSIAAAVKQAAADGVDPVVRILLLKEIVAVVDSAGIAPPTAQNAADLAGALEKAVGAIPASVGTAERVALRQAALALLEPKPSIAAWIRDGLFDGWSETTVIMIARGVQRKLGLPTLLRFEVGSPVIAFCVSKWLAGNVVACYDDNLGSAEPVYEVRVADTDRNGRERLRGAVVPVAIEAHVKEDDGSFRVVDSVAGAASEDTDDEDGVAAESGLAGADWEDDTDAARASSDARDGADGRLSEESDTEDVEDEDVDIAES